MHEFIKTLICFHPAELKKNEPYAALNNPQFLPDEVRVFLTKNGKIDCNFKLCDNLTQFNNCVINNNTNEKTGFCEVINELVNKSMEEEASR
jgi:precorrin-6B methylase 1